MQKILKYIDTGKSEGARLVTGGSQHGKKGYFVQPTIFSNVENGMTIAKVRWAAICFVAKKIGDRCCFYFNARCFVGRDFWSGYVDYSLR